MLDSPPIMAGLAFTALGDGRWIVANADRGVAFKVNSSTMRMLHALTGRSIDDAFATYCRGYPSQLSREEFSSEAQRIVSFLRSKGLRPRRRLTCSATLIGHSTFSNIARRFRWLIKPYLIAANLTASIALWLLTLDQASHFASPSTGVVTVILPIVLIASMLFHEVGHGAALSANGHDAGSLGIGIYLIYPVFFTEMFTLDALTRRGKFLVNIGGVHFQSIFAGCIAIAAIGCHSAAMCRAAHLIYLSALFQLIPINKSDGHRIIFDLIPPGKHWLTGKLEVAAQGASAVFLVASLIYSITRALASLRNSNVSTADTATILNVATTPAALFAAFQISIISLLMIRLIRRRITQNGHIAAP